MSHEVFRREFIGLGCTAGALWLGARVGSAEGGQAPAASYPWPYRQLDVRKVQERAYRSYSKAGCMFGVFEAIAGSVADQLGRPYTEFPFELSAYGGGGVASWGTLCGTCNGAAMAIGLFHQGQNRTALINEVLAWYEAERLPAFTPDAPSKVPAGFAMPSSRADSVLCHVSISRWSGTSGYASFSPERLERCGRVVADVAGYAAGLLNKARGAYTPGRTISDTATGCLSCHAQGKQAPNEPEAVSRMSCTTCHEKAHHQEKKKQ